MAFKYNIKTRFVQHCTCQELNVEMGSHKNAVQVVLPWEKAEDQNAIAWIDICLINEIAELWRLGIKTTGCCCGHGMAWPYIGVYPKFMKKMKSLGYKVLVNKNRKQCASEMSEFVPKSLA